MKIIKLGLVDYQPTFEAMKKFNAERTPETEDELWLVEHPPVFTQGLAGKPEHLCSQAIFPWCKSTAADKSLITDQGNWWFTR